MYFFHGTPPAIVTPERRAYLVFLPLAATLLFYWLPEPLQALTFVQFLPQVIAYLALGLWVHHNTNPLSLLGLTPQHLGAGILWGMGMGSILGLFNGLIILYVLPWMGTDILFLQNTPHAQMPVFIMIPWFIGCMAFFVEANFRGFQLGRLLAYFSQFPSLQVASPVLAITLSALLFSFDPFMVTTFQDLHWIALWDGAIWASFWVLTRNLYATITAHAVEVLIMYSLLKVNFL